MRRHASLVALIWVVACGGGNTPAPAPSPVPSPTPAPSSITVTGFLPSADYPAQFTATAKMADGSTQNVTSMATWQSSNLAVMTVTTAGVVTGVAAGEGNITATDQGVSGTVHKIVETNLWGTWAGTMTITSSNQSLVPNDQCTVSLSVTSEEPQFFSGAPLNITGGNTGMCGPTGALIEGEFAGGSQGTDVVYQSQRITVDLANGAHLPPPSRCALPGVTLFSGMVVGPTTMNLTLTQEANCGSPQMFSVLTYVMTLTKQ